MGKTKSPEHRRKLSESLKGRKMPWISESNHKKKGVKLPERTKSHIDSIRQSRIKNGSYSPLGATYIDSRGYVCVKVTHGEKYNYRHLHRVVMEKHIGRPLERKEMVHHIDGNKENNDISNLALLDFSQHTTINHVITKLNHDDEQHTFARTIINTLKSRYPELL
jgi:uncharacterized protein (DUF1330 family)